MAKLQGKFDSDAKAEMGFKPIPKAKYKMRITESTYKENSKKTGMVLSLRLEVQEGDFENRILFRNLNMEHTSQETTDIAQKEWINLCRACGFPEGTDDSDELHGIDFYANVYVKKGKGDSPDENAITDYESCDDEDSPKKSEKSKNEDEDQKPKKAKKPIFEDDDE